MDLIGEKDEIIITHDKEEIKEKVKKTIGRARSSFGGVWTKDIDPDSIIFKIALPND